MNTDICTQEEKQSEEKCKFSTQIENLTGKKRVKESSVLVF